MDQGFVQGVRKLFLHFANRIKWGVVSKAMSWIQDLPKEKYMKRKVNVELKILTFAGFHKNRIRDCM